MPYNFSFKVYNSTVFSVFINTGITTINSRTFSSAQEKPYLHRLPAQPPRTGLLSGSAVLQLWTPHVTGPLVRGSPSARSGFVPSLAGS